MRRFERWIMTLPLQLRTLFRREQVEAELREEFRYHLERRAEEEIVRGADPAEARRRALRGFGGVEQHIERCRDVRRVAFVEQLGFDLRYAARLLRRDRVFTVIVVLTLMIGIGATTAVFSVVDGVLLRPMPFGDIGQLMVVWGTDRNTGSVRAPVSVPDYTDFAVATAELAELSAFQPLDMSAAQADGSATRVTALASTSTLLPVLGVHPIHGRIFTMEEAAPGVAPAVLISERMWEWQFGRDPDVLARSLELNDRRYRILGVVPRNADFGIAQVLAAADYERGFVSRAEASGVDVWVPLVADQDSAPRYLHRTFILGRLRAGADGAAAAAALTATASDLAARYTVNRDRGVHVEPFEDVVFGSARRALFVLFGAVAFVLLVACANVANLMLVRGTGRMREVAIRTALGAPLSRLGRQFWVENMLLALISGACGVAFALAGLELLLSGAPPDTPRIESVGLNVRVLAFAVGTSLLVGLAFGMIPILQSLRSDVHVLLRREAAHVSATRSRRRLQSGLVVAQIALTVVLLAGAGLLLRSYWNLHTTDPGFVTRGLLKAEFQLPPGRYPAEDWPRLQATHALNEALIRRMASLPGVESVALARNHPLDPGSRNSFSIIGRDDDPQAPELSVRSVSPCYFATVGLSLVAGRDLSAADRVGAPAAAVINESAARRLFAFGDALGQRIAIWGDRREVVGIVANERIHGVHADAPPAIYLPLAQVPPRDGHEALLVRASTDASQLADAVRSVFRELDPHVAVFGIEPLTQTLARSILQRRFTAVLLTTFAGAAVMLALIGIHGVMSYIVLQRKREFGIRMALGAAAGSIMADVLKHAALVSAVGLAIGLLLAAVLARVVSAMLHGIGPGDPTTFVATVAIVSVSAALTCLVPARRASRTDPAVTLREE